MSFLRQTIKNSLSAVLPPRIWLARGPSHCGAVALTFDDGPHRDCTPALLDVLQEQGISATFFVVGKQAVKYPEIVRRIVAEGHALGHHSYFHDDPEHTSARTLLAEMRQCRELLEDITGETCNLFRPPYGKLSAAKLWSACRARQTTVLWNVDPRDYLMDSAEQMQNWSRNYDPQPGDIVLFHDNRPVAAAAIPLLAESVAERRLRFQRVADWISPSCPSTSERLTPQ